MKSQIILITTTLILTSLILITQLPKSKIPNLTQSNTNPWEIYDYYFFALQWGPSMCKKEGKLCYEKIKNVPKNEMTIHGLWPSLLKGKNLEECNKGKKISIKDDSSMKDIRKYWLSLNSNTNSFFWEHEYNKHGFCYNKRIGVDVNNYHVYFNKALEIFKKYNLNKIIVNALGQKSGVASLNYKELYMKVKKVLGGDYFQIICNNVKGTQVLGEIRIGFDLNFGLRKVLKGPGSCSMKKDIVVEFIE